MLEVLETSLVNALIGSAGATTFLIIFNIVRERWF